MKKTLSVVAILLVLVLVLTACSQESTGTTESAGESEPAASSAKPVESDSTESASTYDFTYITPPGTQLDINAYYAKYDVESDVTIRQTGGEITVSDDTEVVFPTPKKEYTIGFSDYYTVDEVGAMYLEAMQNAADKAGVKLLVNDANYDQNLQNQAIEQWILQGVDGVIMTPCDFTGCKGILDQLDEAGIPVITLDAPPQVSTVDAMVIYDCVDQGYQTGSMLKDAILASGREMKGDIIYGTLPFVHPNAVTRLYGFFEAFKDYPDVTFRELTGESPEDHYTVFDGAIRAYPDMLGAWGLYESATIGMLNAMKSNDREDILLSSVDVDKILLAAVYNEEIVGTIGYRAITGSEWSLYFMIELLNGNTIPGIIWQQNTLTTKDNAAEIFEKYYNGKTLADYMAGKD